MAGMSPLELLSNRKGEFDGYTLYGRMFQFRNQLKQGWHVTSTSSLGAVRHYWVERDQFHTVASHIATPPTGANFFDIGDAVEVREAEKVAILHAIGQWTQEYHAKASGVPC